MATKTTRATTAKKPAPKRKKLTPAEQRRITRQLATKLKIAWALVDARSLHVRTAMTSRTEARFLKKPSERVLRIALKVTGVEA